MSAFEDALALIGGDPDAARVAWEAVNGEGIAAANPRMALVVLDTALTLTPATAARLLQRTATAEQDGRVGKITLAQFRIRQRALGPDQMLEIYLECRTRRHMCDLQRDPALRVHRTRWMERVNALCHHVGIPPQWEYP